MQRESTIKYGPPPLKMSAARIAELVAVDTPCANPDCFSFFLPTRKRKKFCSLECSLHVRGLEMHLQGAKAAGDKRRGANPNAHIRIRVNGKLEYAHRVLVENELHIGQRGFANYFCCLPEDSVIHHRDENKHHNCYASTLCENCFYRFLIFISPLSVFSLYLTLNGFSNLEILTDDAARKHIVKHQQRMQAARKARRV